MKNLVVILAAAGAGRRMGLGMNKAFLLLEGLPVIVHNLQQINRVAEVKRAIIVVRPDELTEGLEILQKYESAYFPNLSWQITAGGRERQDSVFNALCLVKDDEEFVAVHDGARPFATPDIFARVFAAAQKSGAAVAAVPVKDTTKLVDVEGRIITTLERSKLRAIQTPQIFRTQLLKRAYEMLQKENVDVTDDAGAVELLGYPVFVAEGAYTNNKITTPEDLIWAKALLQKGEIQPVIGDRNLRVRVGSGFDVHCLTAGRKLILCGVHIPCELGLAGHSDADVAVHALMDAMLGSVALGDIGQHFPDTDEKYKGADSLVLLRHVAQLLREKGWQVGNADITIIAQKPKLAAYRAKMQSNLAVVLELDKDAINVKATTTEMLGFTGRGEGIAAQAVVTVYRSPMQ
ncbi:MAG: 2-C-methyl-D-erythritol 4-phosphate cytidylyltransferase [Acidaminococcaceae bacterium]